MSEAPDKEGRTEQPTEKRLSDARLEGNVPNSREATNLAFLLAGVIGVTWLSSDASPLLVKSLGTIFTHVGDIRIENGNDALTLLRSLVATCALLVIPFILLYLAAGLAATIAQSKPAVIGKRIMPDMSRISPSKGLKRLLGSAGLMEFAKTILRVVAFASAFGYALLGNWNDILTASIVGPRTVLNVSREVVLEFLAVLTCVSLVMLTFDMPLGILLWRRSLRMSHREIKDERRQAEGDAQVKARRRSIAKGRMRRRLKRDVARATVVIANPTHFAVALRYVRHEGGAPRVVAKGQDLVALTIRHIAEESRIPVIEDKALARSLYKKVAVDQAIPVEFYRVIAEILIKLQPRTRSAGLGAIQ